MTDQETDALTIDQLTEVRIRAKLLWESRILSPHEKQHMWQVINWDLTADCDPCEQAYPGNYGLIWTAGILLRIRRPGRRLVSETV